MNLLHGDCLERMKEIPDGSVDMVLTDPPYGTTACKWDSIIPFEPMWEQLKRVTKKNGAIVMTASQPFTTILISSNMKMFKYCWVWKKPKGTGHLNAKRMPMNDCEDIAVFYDKQSTYNPQMTKGKPFKNKTGGDKTTNRSDTENYRIYRSDTENYRIYNDFRYENKGWRYPKRVLEFGVVERGTVHPTQKPVALMEYLIKTYTNEGETVLDFTMGSGTTGVACVNLNRNFIGIERDDKYFQIAVDRIEEAILGY